MIALTVEVFRNEAWKPISRPVAALISVNKYGAVSVNVDVGYLHPPWRIVRDGDDVVLFERQR